MSRYFLDTGVIVGATFLHDAWYQESKRILNSGNTFYVNRAVKFEYCNSTRNNSLEGADVDWDTDEGKFGEKLNSIRPAQTTLNLKLDSISEQELSVDKLVDEFFLASHIYQKIDGELIVNDEKVDPEKFEEYIRPTILRFLDTVIGDQELTRPVARKAIDQLFDEVLDGAHRKREKLRGELREISVPNERREQYRDDFDFVNGYVDTTILCEVQCLSDDNIVNRIVTTDKSHLYGNRDRIDELTILYVKDIVADPSLPSEE
jgi:predicted nucleic acid-binding protein